MINIPINVQLPQLWGNQVFKKGSWSSINLIVGSNGTGKSLLADQFKNQLVNQGLKVRLLNAERLAGFEKMDYNYFQNSQLHQGINISNFEQIKQAGNNYGLSTSAFVILKERLDIRIKIEALLSDIFKKSIRLIEEGGFLKPMIQNISGGDEYGLKESECHGLKELLTLLTFIYDISNNCLILDEPELHLHPQFQSFLLNEIRAIAGNPLTDPTKKLFFIITHSPYFLDLRSIDEFKSVLVAHHGVPPTFVDVLDTQEEYILKRFLPRFNTHHKQFFFSPNPVYVEGYTDQQIITLLFDRLDYKISAAGSCVIDVGGKDELAVFFNLCKKLKIKGRIIADLDAFFKGKLREVVQADVNSNLFIQTGGFGTDLSGAIGDVETKLMAVANDLITKSSTDPDVSHIISFLKPIIGLGDRRHHVLVATLMALRRFKDKILPVASTAIHSNINFILPRFDALLNAFKVANVFIIPIGEIEHYYIKTSLDYLNFSDNQKNTSFHVERDYILSEPVAILEAVYADLMLILRESVPQIKVDLYLHLKYQILEWLQKVQNGISKGEVIDIATLTTNAKIDYKLFNQIIEVEDLKIEEDRKFICRIMIKASVSATEKVVSFNERTIAHDFELSA